MARHARAHSPDFIDDESVDWFLHYEMDFENNPVTHYDHLCAAFGNGPDRDVVRLVRIGDRDALSISDGSDTFGWCAERRAIVANSSEPPSNGGWADAVWTPCVELTVREESLVLMNATVHGAQVLSEDEEHELVTLPAGLYRVESAQIDNGFVVRFVLADLEKQA